MGGLSVPNINLLPGSNHKGKKLGGIIFLIFVSLVWMVVCFWLTTTINKEIAGAKNEYSTKEEDVATLEKKLTELNEAINVAESEAAGATGKVAPKVSKEDFVVIPEIFPLLIGLETAAPKGAWITRLETKNELCRIEGFALRAQDVSEFLRNARGIDGVTKATLVETKRDLFPNRKIPLHHFQLEVTLGGGAS